MNSRAPVLIALALAALSGAIITAAITWAVCCAHAEGLDAYGFTAPQTKRLLA
jgi:hypothetical protein